MRNLISQQKANGIFGFQALNSIFPKVTQENLKQFLSSLSLPVTDETIELLATAIACLYFERKFLDQKVQWTLVVKKSFSTLKKNSQKLNITEDWENAAKSFWTNYSLS